MKPALTLLVIGAALVLAEPTIATSPPHHDAVPVLMYHVIGEPPVGAPYPDLYASAASFEREVAQLAAAGYAAVTLSDVWRHWRYGTPLPARPVVLTFDDGHWSAATVALPILRRHRWPGVLNLKVGNVPSAITTTQVRLLVAAGWELGAHTLTHPSLPGLDDQSLRREIAGSRTAIQRRFHTYVRFFCYPAGDYDRRVVASVRAAGFVGATTTEPGLARRSEPFTLHRIRVAREDTDHELIHTLAQLTQHPG